MLLPLFIVFKNRNRTLVTDTKTVTRLSQIHNKSLAGGFPRQHNEDDFYYLPQIISIICQIINQNRLNNKLFALGCVRNLTLVPKHNDHTFSLFQRTPTSTNTL